MRQSKKQARLDFIGWNENGHNVTILARIAHPTGEGRWLPAGPLLQLQIPNERFLADVIDLARERADREQRMTDEAGQVEQDPLF